MTHRFRSAVAAVALTAALATSAPAQDGDSTSAPWRFESRAVDHSAMLLSQHGGSGGDGAEVPLPHASIRVLVRAPGQSSSSLETETDMVGRFVLEGPQPPPGATLEFFVTGESGEDGRPGYYGRPWPVDDGAAPDVVQFYQVATEPPEGMYLANVINVVSTVDRDQDPATQDDLVVQVRHTAMLVHQGFRVWLGDLSRNDFSTFGIRIPPGFQLGNVTVDNQRVDPSDVGTSGHDRTEKWLWREPIFPSMQKPRVFQAIFTAPYEKGAEYDLSWHNELFVGQYTLNVESGRFTYLPPETSQQGVQLADGGTNPAMGNIQIVTQSYGLQQIPPHQTLSARIAAGTPFPWKAVIWTGSILGVVLGAGLLGYFASRPKKSLDAEIADARKRAKVPQTSAGREHELEILQRRLKRGEITRVEFDVRKAALERAGQAPAAPPPRKPRSGIAEELGAIEGRVETADADQLRDDVRTLAKAVHRLLGER